MQLAEFYDILSYEFKNNALLEEALTHPSMSGTSRNQNGKQQSKSSNYERLEFLGDAVLGMVITEFLINEYKEEQEGALAKRRSALVCGKTLSEIAKQINLGTFLVMTDSESNSGGRENQTNLENSLEAVIGALYLDGGLEIARNFIHKYWLPLAYSIKEPPKDAKTALQEWSQKLGKPIPEYVTTNVEGPPHASTFTVEVRVAGMQPVSARASSKRLAEHAAAELLYQKAISTTGDNQD